MKSLELGAEEQSGQRNADDGWTNAAHSLCLPMLLAAWETKKHLLPFLEILSHEMMRLMWNMSSIKVHNDDLIKHNSLNEQNSTVTCMLNTYPSTV